METRLSVLTDQNACLNTNFDIDFNKNLFMQSTEREKKHVATEIPVLKASVNM